MKSKNKGKSQSKNLNLCNPKQMEVINLFAISEGRVSKENIYSTGNKEIFYRMKNNGFIKETAKGSGYFKATNKLKTLVNKTEGISFGNGCSNKHSETITKATSYFPKDVVSEGRFTSCRSQGEYYQNKINYRQEMKTADMKKEIIYSGNPAFIPDLSIKVTRDEAQEIIDNMRSRIDESDNPREKDFLNEDIEKLSSLISTAQGEYIEVYFEIVTNSYGSREIEMHRNYEVIMERPVLYIC